MSTRLVSAVSNLALVTGLALLAACNHLQAPRFTLPPNRGQSFRCRSSWSSMSPSAPPPWNRRSAPTCCGKVVWAMRSSNPSPKPVGPAWLICRSVTRRERHNDYCPRIRIHGLHHAGERLFTPTSRSGSDDINYLAQFDVRLVATFQDSFIVARSSESIDSQSSASRRASSAATSGLMRRMPGTRRLDPTPASSASPTKGMRGRVRGPPGRSRLRHPAGNSCFSSHVLE